MTAKLAALANQQIQDIWLYTERRWGEAQATEYVTGLFDFFETLPFEQHLWRAVPRSSLRGALYASYREHIVFFRHLSNDNLGILSVLHQRQDIPHDLNDINERFSK